MAINFPNTPTVNDTHTVGLTTYTWDGTSWDSKVQGGDSITGVSTISGTYQETITAGDPVYSIEEPAVPGGAQWNTSVTAVTQPSNMPAADVFDISWSSDDTYMAIAGKTTPLIIYKRSGDTFTKLTDPSTLPGGYAVSIAFSDSDTYLSVGHSTSPYVNIYKRSGDTFTKLSNPSTLPTSVVYGTSWSSDDTYMACAHTTSPYITIYKRSGDTFTKLSNPSTLPTAFSKKLEFDPTDTYLAVPHTNTFPYVTIYKRSGDTFTKLTDPSTLPTGAAESASWSPDGNYLVVGHSTSPYMTIYSVDSATDTFTKLSNPATLPAERVYMTSWTSDSKFLSASHYQSVSEDTVQIYERSGDTFTEVDTLAAGRAPYALSFSNLDEYLSVGRYDSPYLDIYKTTFTAGTSAYNKISLAGNDIATINTSTMNAIGYAGSSGVLNDAKTDITAIWKEVA